MTQENERQKQIRDFILDETEKRAEMLGEDRKVVEKIVEGEQSLVDSGLFDSISFLELLSSLEDKFDVEVDMSGHDLEYFVTFEGLSDVISKMNVNHKTDEKSEPEKIKTNDLPQTVDGILYEELTAEHPCWQELAKLFNALYEYMETFGLFVPLKSNGAELWLKSLENGLGKTQVIFGAIDNGKLVGYFHAVLKILPVYLEGNLIGEILSNYVSPEYRNRKIADRLQKKSRQWLENKNISSIEVKVMTENKAVINYWLRRDFKEELIQLRTMTE